MKQFEPIPICGPTRYARGRRRQGTSLVEVLVVIVIFLVGILAVAQVFPGGFRVLNQSRDTALANQLAQAERDRLLAQGDSIPGDVVVARYQVRDVPVIEADTTVRVQDYGILAGAIARNGLAIGPNKMWTAVSGPNLARRIVGERAPLRAPRPTPAGYGIPVQLLFGPLDPDGRVTLGVGELKRILGRPDDVIATDPNARLLLSRPHFFADRTKLYIPRRGTARMYEVRLGFVGDDGRSVVGAAFEVPAGTGYEEVPYSRFGPSGAVEATPRTVQVAIGFTQLPYGTPFGLNPYEFVVSDALSGRLLVNPFLYEEATADSDAPMLTLGYDVLDWRIIRDDFRVADQVSSRQKLAMRNLKVLGNAGVDGLPYAGLGFNVPRPSAGPGPTDFALIDLESGGVVLSDSYRVDKSAGVVTFTDVAASTPGLQANVSLNGMERVMDIGGRRVRALYQAVGEWAVHFEKASSGYQRTDGRPGLGEFRVGDGTFGRPTRLYFARSEVGKTVFIGDQIMVETATGGLKGIGPASFVIRASAADVLPYIDVTEVEPDAVRIDGSDTFGDLAKGLGGGSLRVLVSRNPESFSLGDSPTENLRGYERWARNWRKTASDSFVGGATR